MKSVSSSVRIAHRRSIENTNPTVGGLKKARDREFHSQELRSLQTGCLRLTAVFILGLLCRGAAAVVEELKICSVVKKAYLKIPELASMTVHCTSICDVLFLHAELFLVIGCAPSETPMPMSLTATCFYHPAIGISRTANATHAFARTSHQNCMRLPS